MRLNAINYSQFEHTPREWVLSGLTLGPVTLLVGKNATGKTRALNIIQELAKLLSGKQKLAFTSGTYDTTFEHQGDNPGSGRSTEL